VGEEEEEGKILVWTMVNWGAHRRGEEHSSASENSTEEGGESTTRGGSAKTERHQNGRGKSAKKPGCLSTAFHLQTRTKPQFLGKE